MASNSHGHHHTYHVPASPRLAPSPPRPVLPLAISVAAAQRWPYQSTPALPRPVLLTPRVTAPKTIQKRQPPIQRPSPVVARHTAAAPTVLANVPLSLCRLSVLAVSVPGTTDFLSSPPSPSLPCSVRYLWCFSEDLMPVTTGASPRICCQLLHSVVPGWLCVRACGCYEETRCSPGAAVYEETLEFCF